jgi:hypothetical protein
MSYPNSLGGLSGLGSANLKNKSAECSVGPIQSQGRVDSPRTAGIRDRIERARYGAQVAFERVQAADRAAQILEKYPEFGELLDLIGKF